MPLSQTQIRLRGRLAVAFAVPVMWGACVANPVDEGRAKLTDGEPRAAMIRFEQALKINPDDMTARLGLAEALVRLGAFDRAEKMARVVLRREPSSQASLVLAEALFGQSRFDEAQRALAPVPEGIDKAALGALIDAEAYLTQAQPEDALAGLGEALSHPRFGGLARLSAARAQYMRGDLVRARRLVEELKGDGVRAAPALTLRARLALRSGDAARARRLAQDLLSVDDTNMAAGAIGVEAALREEDTVGARHILSQLNPVEPNDPRPLYLEALVLLHEGKVAQAATVVGPIEPWLVNSAGGATLLAQIKVQTGRAAQAESILRDRLARAPADVSARRLLIQLYQQSDRMPQAQTVLAKGLALTPHAPGLLQQQAQLALAAGRYADAEAALAKVMGADTALADFLGAGADEEEHPLLEALGALQQGGTVKALEAAQAAVTAEPTNPLAQNLLAAAKARTGDREGAKAALDQLIQAHPDFFAAILNRASLNEGPDALRSVLLAAQDAGATSKPILSRLAEEHFVAGEREASLAVVRQVVADSPSDSERVWAGRLFYAAGDNAQTAAVLQSVKDGDQVAAAARLLLAVGQSAAALSLLDGIASVEPEMSLLKAEAQQAQGLHGAAEDTLSEAFHASSSSQNVTLAVAWLEAVSVQDLSRAFTLLDSDPALASFRGPVMKARLAAGAGDMATAWEWVTMAPVDLPALAQKASMKRNDMQTKALIGDLIAYTTKRPTDFSALLLLSGVALDAGEVKQAEAALSAALAVAPGQPLVLNNLALARRASDPEGAMRLIKTAFSKNHENPAIIETYADFLRENGSLEKAERIVRRGLLFAPLDEGLANWGKTPG
ncbi:MAG: tetratricopeptide repeat protein [Pseudomonadota bacterium]